MKKSESEARARMQNRDEALRDFIRDFPGFMGMKEDLFGLLGRKIKGMEEEPILIDLSGDFISQAKLAANQVRVSILEKGIKVLKAEKSRQFNIIQSLESEIRKLEHRARKQDAKFNNLRDHAATLRLRLSRQQESVKELEKALSQFNDMAKSLQTAINTVAQLAGGVNKKTTKADLLKIIESIKETAGTATAKK